MRIYKSRCKIPKKTKTASIIIILMSIFIIFISLIAEPVVIGKGIYISSNGANAFSGINLWDIFVFFGIIMCSFGITMLIIAKLHKDDYIEIYENKLIIQVLKNRYEFSYEEMISCKTRDLMYGIIFETTTHNKPIKLIYVVDASKIVYKINQMKSGKNSINKSRN